MLEYAKKTAAKSGEPLVIRSLKEAEAPAVIWLMHRCMGESLHLSRYPDEMRFTVAQEEEFIRSANQNPDSVLLGAFSGEELVGICSALPVAPNERYRHRAGLGIMIVKTHWGKGIGHALMKALQDAMLLTNVEQIELDVVSTNVRAIALYEQFGFVQYGLLENGMKYRDGSYADLLLMRLDLTKLR